MEISVEVYEYLDRADHKEESLAHEKRRPFHQRPKGYRRGRTPKQWRAEADTPRADKFIEIVKKHTDFSELTPQMIVKYIEKIVVHEAVKLSGEQQ